MTVSVRYIGTSRPYFETGVTGKQTSWYPGEAAAVPDADALLLLATGVFEYGETAGGKSANDNRTIQSFAAAVVGAAGIPIAQVDLAATTGTAERLYQVSDGENRGAKLVWAVPEGESVATWCWWLWPQASYF